MSVIAPTKSPVTTYAEAVVSGQVLAGRFVRLACQRHLNDLSEGMARGLRFDDDAAQAALDFFGFLCLSEGEFAGQPFILQPFQEFIVGCLFGWKGRDGFRRFRNAYIEMGKGNGKTPLAAGIGLLGLVADGEMSAEVYTAGVTRDQASYLFRDATRMVESTAALNSRIEVLAHNMSHTASGSVMRPVSSEGRSLDQKRVHMALIDEIHEHPTDIVVQKMRAGTKMRRQALIVEITNSGYDRNSVCFAHHEYSGKVLEDVFPDDAWFAYVCQLDPCEKCLLEGQVSPKDGCADCDDWRDEAVWIKVNPNLGISVPKKYLEEQVHEAIGMPSKENIVKRLNFCIWTEQSERWIPLQTWDSCAASVDGKALAGRLAYAGLDMSKTNDLTALVLVFPDGEGYAVLPFFWIPEAGMQERMKTDRVPYDQWLRAGLIKVTEGAVIDYRVVRRDIRAIGETYRIQEIMYDDYNIGGLDTELTEDGFEMTPCRSTFANLSSPSKELERLLQSKAIRHGGNPVLRWNVSNVVVMHNAEGDIRPTRSSETGRVDGVVSLVMGVKSALRHGDETSIYEERGILVI